MILFNTQIMKDYCDFYDNKFRKKIHSFNLQEALNEVIGIVQCKADQNNVFIHFTPLFSNDDYSLDIREIVEF